MKYDVFFSICQTEVDGYIPSERVMFENFFDQLKWADELGYETAWLAETHLSCQVQKENPGAVIPHFKGEIGLNTDILQLGHKIFSMTKSIHIGSAIRNILCNGGPIAHAEAVRTFLALHSLDPKEERLLYLGFAAGRFPFSNTPYGIFPRTETEKAAWPVMKGKILLEATEIFTRFLRGDIFAAKDVQTHTMTPEDFRSEEDWGKAISVYEAESGQKGAKEIPVLPRWNFDKVGVIPFETPLDHLRLVIGSQDPKSQKFANQFYPTGVFNLSITPGPVIEETHQRMKKDFHPDGGEWTRTHMPRTVLVFVNEDSNKAKAMATNAVENYWRAIQGTLDTKKIENAVDNALVGTPEEVTAQVRERFHPEDRLMLWFDFNNHNSAEVKENMRLFMEKVVPNLD